MLLRNGGGCFVVVDLDRASEVDEITCLERRSAKDCSENEINNKQASKQDRLV